MNMETNKMVEQAPSLKWLLQRKKTTYIFIIQNFLFGIEWSMFFLTLWIYLQTINHSDDTKLFYSLISTSYLVISICLTPLAGYIIDKTRDVRRALLIGNFFIILGNIIFAIPYSPYYLLAGRLLAGLGVSVSPVISAEIARSYERKEVARQISIASAGYIMGFVLGPCVGFPFTNVNIHVTSTFVISYGNASALFLALIFSFNNVAVYLLATNLSKEYDLKSAFYEQKDGSSSKETIPEKIRFIDNYSDTDDKEFTEMLSTFNKQEEKEKDKNNNHWLCNIKLITLYILNLFNQSNLVICDMWIPMLVNDVLHWKVIYLNLIFLCFSILLIILLSVSYAVKLPKLLLMAILFTSIVAAASLSSILTVIRHFKVNEIVIPLFVVFTVFYPLAAIANSVVYPVAIANMVPSNRQTLAESIRLSLARAGSCIALLTAPFLFTYILEYSIFITVIFSLCFLVVLNQRNAVIKSF